MFDAVPARAWLVLAILAVAWGPARHVFRHLFASSSQRDNTQPTDDLSRQSTALLKRNTAILVVLALFAAFIFTPAAEAFAKSPSFPPLLLLGLGSFMLLSVVTGFRTGSVEPMVQHVNWVFTRAQQPKRFWASMVWNAVWAGTMIGFGLFFFIEAPKWTLRDRCLDRKDEYPPTAVISACNEILTEGNADDRSDALAWRGSAYFRLGQYERAGTDYAAASRLDPEDASSHYNLGLVHERLGRRERALAEYSVAIAINPADPDAFENRGLIYLNSRRFDQAIADFTRALALDPDDVSTRANRGMAHAWKSDAIRAEQDFAFVRRRDPSNIVLLHGEALLAMDRDDIDGAIRLLDKAIALQPRDEWALYMRAEAFRAAAHRSAMGDDPGPPRH